MDRFNRLAVSETPQATASDTFRFVFSNEKVGRDGHVVRNAGIQTTNYQRNPVVLWAHDNQQPPIGRGSHIDTTGVNCRLDVSFVSRDVLPFAGTIRDLVAGKWLNALSMSWQPLEWRYSTDKNRSGGIDFLKVDLLEVSVCPLPALPDALADARSRGINLSPLRDWTSRALDTHRYGGIPRPQLEALHRAARPRRQTRADRVRIARAIADREQRRNEAAAILTRMDARLARLEYTSQLPTRDEES